MSDIKTFKDNNELAKTAALDTINVLNNAIKTKGYGIWVLAGGNTPLKAYEIIANSYKNSIDYTKLYFLLGDERSVKVDEKDSNLNSINKTLLSKLEIDESKLILPSYCKDNFVDAKNYSEAIKDLFNKLGSNSIDLLWLGMGEDGHTLSLFPDSKEINDFYNYVLPINNSPKPPNKRITFGLKGLSSVSYAFILTSGKSKAAVFKSVISGFKLPINEVINYLENHQTKVSWYIDKDLSS